MFDMDVFRRSFLRNLALAGVLLFGGAAVIMLLATTIGMIGMLAGELDVLCELALLGMTAGFAVLAGICAAIAEGFGVNVFDNEKREEKPRYEKREDEWD